MSDLQGTVYIVDDDASARAGLHRLVRSKGLQSHKFSSAREFLKHGTLSRPSCLILDVHMPELTGLDLQTALAEAGLEIPMIFLTGHGTIPMGIQAMKSGAVDFLTKPLEQDTLFAAVEMALVRDADSARQASEESDIHSRLASLTPREREVLGYVVAGFLNKQIAGELGAAEKTIKVHRGRMMQKMGVPSVAELVRLTQRVGVPLPGK